jgi:pilus assembly protein CpaB
MKRRPLVALAALVLAAMGTLAVLTYAQGADRRALQGQEAVNAYVVRKEVPAGTTAEQAVKDGLIVHELIARRATPADALGTVGKTYGSLVATSTLQPGELVLKSRFGTKVADNGLLAVPSGKMAVSVPLDDASHVGSFLVAGSKIAVFDTFNVQEKFKSSDTPAGDRLQDEHDKRRATRLLLAHVDVLAVGASTSAPGAQSSSDAADGGTQNVAQQTPSAGTTTLVTLAVSQDQAQKLIHGSRTGTLTFTLLGSGTSARPGTGTDDRRLFEESAR